MLQCEAAPTCTPEAIVECTSTGVDSPVKVEISLRKFSGEATDRKWNSCQYRLIHFLVLRLLLFEVQYCCLPVQGTHSS